MVRLCNFSSPAEELARKDDLSLLFSAITSWCPNHNTVWRKSAGEVLVTLSRHGLTSTVVKYIHGKYTLSYVMQILIKQNGCLKLFYKSDRTKWLSQTIL